MTAHALDSDRERTQAAGMNDHVTKPIEPKALYAALIKNVPGLAGTGAGAEGDFQPEQHAPVEAVPGTLPAKLPGLDVAGGLARMGGDEVVYKDFLCRFMTLYADQPGKMRQALDAGDTQQACQLAHGLRGVAANLGGSVVEKAAAELEAACDQQAEMSSLTGLADALEADLANLLDVLASLDACPKAQAPEPVEAEGIEPAPAPKRRVALEAMTQALGTGKPRACRVTAGALRALAWPPEQQVAVAEICALAKRFNYQTALERAEALLKQFEESAA
jgi:two-component system, sensor histidine kinase and response regulator